MKSRLAILTIDLVCPVHGKPPKIKATKGKVVIETCCDKFGKICEGERLKYLKGQRGILGR